VVNTGKGIIKVLGTSFSIDASGSEVQVCVESGTVELSKPEESIAVVLEKGDKGEISDRNKGIIKKPNEDENYLAWKTRVLSFKETGMREVKRILEDVYGVSVIIEDTNILDCTITSKMKKKKLKEVLEIISRTLNLDYTIEKREVTLRGFGC
ncbi:MAG: FecR domain-containing protein, partial [Bacteroidota bacterium]